MPYSNNNGVKIHYEEEGQGPPLVLQHGIMMSINRWRVWGYTDALREEYTLILIDARGHGESDKPHEPGAYTPEYMTGDVAAVLDDLGVEKTRYWGYSMGSMIGFQLLKSNPTRFSSFVLGGMSPYAWQSKEEQDYIGFLREGGRIGARDGAEALITAMEKAGPLTESWKQQLRETDWPAIDACFRNLDNWSLADDVLAGFSTPCLLYAGSRDPWSSGARRCAGVMPSASFVSIPGLDHSDTFDASSLVLPHVKRFLSEAA
ncbi:MAG: alpha/beta hydrolase [Candidatus Bathyarchaeia archaeon]|jgi:pimeloyl-ACP methyl ester carboxylesterase